jgi:hypothetical protein
VIGILFRRAVVNVASVKSAQGFRPALLFIAALLCIPCAKAQQSPPQSDHSNAVAGTLDERLRALQQQMSQMQEVMNSMCDEITRSRAESAELRREMQATRSAIAAQSNLAKTPSGVSKNYPSDPTFTQDERASSSSAPQAGISADENQQFVNANLAELHQTKVESGSKYHLRLSGIVLLNAVENRGTVDNLDFPSLAIAAPPGSSQGSFGATLRQSSVGISAFGPQFLGARISGDAQFDFAGNSYTISNGTTFGFARLRTGLIHLDWQNTSLIAGQDVPFISPLSPTSIASIALPEFSYSGNLWNWIPQIRIEHRIQVGENSKILFQGGILDPVSGESTYAQYSRLPLAGEASRQPAYSARAAWTRRLFDHDLTLGVGSYYSRQNWGFHRNADAWAGTADWSVPLSTRWELSGEFYRGRAIGGLGGGLGRSVVLTGPLNDSNSSIQALNALGGWTQIKFRQTEKLEWNVAYGLDNSFSSDLRDYPVSAPGDYAASIARNHTGFANFIYRPRSDLLLSLEYRRLQTSPLVGPAQTADHINLGIGLLF